MQNQKNSTNDEAAQDQRQTYLEELAKADVESSFCGEEDPGAAFEFLMRDDIGEMH